MSESPKQKLGKLTVGHGSGKPLASKDLGRLRAIEASEFAYSLATMTS